jgi:cytoskeleton protein RodZ
MTKFTQMAANEDDGASRRRIHLREISGDGENPLETVGQDLRAARIRRGDDLAAVSRALKIRKDHLDALENDRLDDLPGKTYAIGFVRSYARYLGLDATETTERFKAEISGRHDDNSAPASGNLHEEEARRLPYGGRVLAGIIILAVLYGVWHIFFATRDATPPTPPPPTLARITDTPAAPSAPTPQAPAMTPDLSQAQAAAPALTPPAAASPVAVVTPSTAATPPPAASQAAVPAVPGAPQVLGEQNRANGRVVLRVRGATRITVTGPDNRLYINRDLAAGEVYYVPNLPGLRLALSNAGAVQVDVDGKPMGRVGTDNVAVGRVSLDPQSLTDRFNSR